MGIRYLAYGSNLHPRRLRERTPSARLIGTAEIPGWHLSFTKCGRDGSGKCTISNGGDGVHCAIYEMSRQDKKELDAIEGVGRGYFQHALRIPEFGVCLTYIAETTYVDDTLVPYCWYRELVLAGAIAHGFDEHYVARIRLLETRTDIDAARRAQNERLVRLLYKQGRY